MGVGEGVLGFGVAVGPPTGGAVGDGVGEAVAVAVAVAVSVGVGVGVGVGLAVVRVKERAVQEDGTAAFGFEVGAVGATGCCLN